MSAPTLDPVLPADPVEPASSEPLSLAVPAAALAAAVVAVRLVAVRGRHEYSLWPDEPAQLAIARFVGGGTHWTMRNHSIWRPGYGTLLGPVYAVTDDPLEVFRAAMVLNAVLGGVAAVLLWLLARRLTPLGPWAAAVAALAVAVTPAILFPTGLVWSESLIAPIFLGCVLAMLRFVDAPSLGRGLVVAGLCGAGFVTHSRLLALAAVTLVLVGLELRRARIGRSEAALIVAALGAALLAASWYSAYVTEQLWDQPSQRNSIGGVVGQLVNPGPIAVSAVGQVWYLVAGSLGLVGVAAVEVARRLRGEPAFQVLALVVLGQVSLSVVFMADRWRPDQLVYGRYNDIVAAPLILVGLGAVAGGRWAWRQLAVALAGSAGFVLAGGLLLRAIRGAELRESNGLEPMILAIQPFSDGRPTLAVVRISLIVVAGTAVLVAVARFGRVAVTGLLAALLVIGFVRTEHVMNHGWNGQGGLEEIADLEQPGQPLAGGQPVDYYLPARSNSTGRLMVYQWYLPGSDFTVVADPLTQAGSPYVFAETDNAALAASGATRVWRDPSRPISLWRREAPSEQR